MMNSRTVIQVANLAKKYRTGEISTGTLVQDINQWWLKVRGKPDVNRAVPTAGIEWGKESSVAAGPAPVSSPSEHVWALKDLNFEVQQGEVLGIIGRNGAGKSTLLKILSRITAPTTGEVRLKGRVSSLLEVGTGFHRDLTGRENIFLNGAIQGMTKEEINIKIKEIIEFSGCQRYIDTPVKRYSSGMVVRLGFAVAAHLEPEILIVDEVLAVGDADFQKKCIGKMQDVAEHGRTILFVSHNLAAVRNLCTQGMLIQDGQIVYQGTCEDTLSAYRDSQGYPDEGALSEGIIFDVQEPDTAVFGITRMEVLDIENQRKAEVHTWDPVKIRVHYFAPEPVDKASVWLQISTEEDMPILRLSTQPDSNMSMRFVPGAGYVDCVIPQLPLPEGEFWVGGGLAVPNQVPLFRNQRLGKLKVESKDVFQSGLPPSFRRMLTVVPHNWESPSL